MKNFKLSFQSIIIVTLVAIILLLRQCSGPVTPTEPQIIRDTVVEYITIEKEYPVYVPKIKYLTKVDIDTFQAPVDTSAILADYYAIRTYEDTQVLDSLDLTITDTVSQNQILGRKIAYNFTYPRKTIKETIIINKRELYVGLGMAGNADQINYFGGEMVYKDKKNKAFGLGVGINQDLVPIISARLFWKLGK